MSWIRFDCIAGKGVDGLYNLYIDGQRVGEALSYEELHRAVTEAEEERGEKSGCSI